MAVLEKAVADLVAKGGDAIVGEIIGLLRRGLVEAIEYPNGEYGFRATELGAAMLDARKARKH